MSSQVEEKIWKETPLIWAGVILVSLFLGLLFKDSLASMVDIWINMEEYGHGFLLPVISAFLIWQKKDVLERLEFNGSWYGVLIVVIGQLLFILGDISELTTIIQYSFLIVVYGLFLSFVGWSAFKILVMPLLILFFMIPLPNIVFNSLSAELQLISSQIGVFVIRLFGISVFLEGNVIDLGQYKLQVVEACSGLRYLFPLMSLSFIAAYFFKGALWKRILIFLSAIPLTVFMNSFRIGVIGVLVEYWGSGMAEGFLHDFEGWVVFMGCIVLLIFEMWLLASIGKNKCSLSDAFGLYFPDPSPEGFHVQRRKLPRQFTASAVLVLMVLLLSYLLPDRVMNIDIERKTYVEFPKDIDEWKGVENTVENKFLDILQLDDYILIDYRKNEDVVNFYSAYYKFQERGGKAIHSPRACIAGNGWNINELKEYPLDGFHVNGKTTNIYRAIIKRGESRHLVYYLFKQRNRYITNELMVKWFLFVDSILKGRTDGALIRFTTVIKDDDDIEMADKRLTEVAAKVMRLIPEYVPD